MRRGLAQGIGVLLAALAAGAASAWVHGIYRDWDMDDAFIAYRYARNVAAGHGWAFNPGEAWNASTSVLSPLLSAGVSLATGDVRGAAHLLGALWLFAGGLCAYLLCAARGRWLAAAVLCVAVPLFPPLHWTWGLETALFVAALMSYLALAERPASWGLVGVLFLVRPDGALLGALRFAREWLAARRAPWRGAALALAVALPWLVFSAWRFSSVVPASLASKVAQGADRALFQVPEYLLVLAQHARQVFGPSLGPALALGLLGLWRARRLSPVLSDLALFVLLQQGLYASLRLPPFDWYYAVPLLSLVVFAALGLDELVTPRFGRGPALALGVALALGLVVAWLPSGAPPRLPKEAVYATVGRFLGETNPPVRSVALAEAGAVAFFGPGDLRIVDIVRLVSGNPEYYSGRHNDDFFERTRPEAVLLHWFPAGASRAQAGPPADVVAREARLASPVVEARSPRGSVDAVGAVRGHAAGTWPIEDALFRDPRFTRDYELVKVFEPGHFAYDQLALFRRRPRAKAGADGFLLVRGWAGLPDLETSGDSTWVSLCREGCLSALTVRAEPHRRFDVAEALGRRGLGACGFVAAFRQDELGSLAPGEHAVVIHLAEGGRLHRLDTGARVTLPFGGLR